MVKMPGKSNKPPRSRKRSPANSTETSIHSLADLEQESLHNDELARSLVMNSNPVISRLPESQASHYPPAYRDDAAAGSMAMGGYPPGGMQQMPPPQHHGQNGMGMMGSSSAPPMQFHPPSKPVVENGYNHVGSLVEKDIFNRTLEQNAQIILQVNQAMADNRVDLIGDLMNQLGKNINFLSAAAEPTPHPSSAMASSGENVGNIHGPARISQSPLPVRPHSQATPPHVSPPPGMPQQQQNFQTPPNGQQYGQQPPVGYPPSYGGQPAQARPNPVYSPLVQSTHGPGYSPKSPNGPFPQQTANGFPPNRPLYHQGNLQQQQAFQAQQQQQQMQQPQPSTSNSMPPPQNYPYVGQARGPPSYGPGQGGYGSYQPQDQQADPNFTSMPPPQMQPKRSNSSGHRGGMPQGGPQGPVPDQRQMMYQQRPYMDPYAQQQQQMQHYGPGPPHPQMMTHPSSVPSGQYQMQQQQQQQGQFRSPAPPGSAYGSPSPGGAGS